MAAAGKVTTGFSLPYVALYTVSSGTITYSSGQQLARGVNVTIAPSSSEENIFYADNVAAESAPGEFTGGTITLTVDGLLPTAERLIYGLPAADGSGWTWYGDSMSIPYVGIGFIVRQQQDGVESFTPMVISKARFSLKEDTAATQEESIDWQTQTLEATIFRGDDSNRAWKGVGTATTTEALALAALKTALDIA